MRRSPGFCAVVFLTGVGLAWFTPGLLAAGVPLSVQGCNTRCQEVQTDCVLQCDGEVPCVQHCQMAANSCTERCSRPRAPTEPRFDGPPR